MCTGLHSGIGRHDDDICLSIDRGHQRDDTVAELILQLVTEITQRAHLNVLELRGKELHTLDIDSLLERITERILGRLGLQGLDLGVCCLQVFLQVLDLRDDLGRIGLQKLCCFCQCVLEILVICHYCIPGQSFDSSYAGSDTGFGEDLDALDLGGIADVRTTAELDRESFLKVCFRITGSTFTHTYDTNGLVILLTEESHRTGLTYLGKTHLIGFYRKRCSDLGIDDLLYFRDLLGRHGSVVGEVETQTVRCNERTFLLDVITENDLQCFLQKMRRGVVLTSIVTVLILHRDLRRLSDTDGSFCNIAGVADLRLADVDRLCNNEFSVICNNVTLITDLAPHGSIEAGNVCDDGTLLAFGKLFFQRGLIRSSKDLTFAFSLLVADELCLDALIEIIENTRGCAELRGEVLAVTCLLLLLFHRRLKSVFIYGKSFFFCQLDSKLERESECIIEIESVAAGQCLLSGSTGLVKDLLKLLHAVLQGALETLDLLGQLV